MRKRSLKKWLTKSQQQASWGSGLLEQLSQDLINEFPEIKGFSHRNLKYISQWHRFWARDAAIGQQAVAQLQQIPWGHNVHIMSKCQTTEEARYYVRATIEYGWSRSVLTHQVESGLYLREGKAISNFETTLPSVQSDLAQQALKDPYVFDFLTLSKGGVIYTV